MGADIAGGPLRANSRHRTRVCFAHSGRYCEAAEMKKMVVRCRLMAQAVIYFLVVAPIQCACWIVVRRRLAGAAWLTVPCGLPRVCRCPLGPSCAGMTWSKGGSHRHIRRFDDLASCSGGLACVATAATGSGSRSLRQDGARACAGRRRRCLTRAAQHLENWRVGHERGPDRQILRRRLPHACSRVPGKRGTQHEIIWDA